MEDLVFMLLRFLHFLFGITWIGLLYYFNLVQTPFFARPNRRCEAARFRNWCPRALWWFRWGAMGTVIFGLLYLLPCGGRAPRLRRCSRPWTVAIFTGGTDGHRHVGQRMVRHLAQSEIGDRQRSCDGRWSARQSRRGRLRTSRWTSLAHQHSVLDPDAVLHGRREPLPPVHGGTPGGIADGWSSTRS